MDDEPGSARRLLGVVAHPDDVAISARTTEVFRAQARDHDPGQRLYHAVWRVSGPVRFEQIHRHGLAGGRIAALPRARRPPSGSCCCR